MVATNDRIRGRDLALLMRRLNALEAGRPVIAVTFHDDATLNLVEFDHGFNVLRTSFGDEDFTIPDTQKCTYNDIGHLLVTLDGNSIVSFDTDSPATQLLTVQSGFDLVLGITTDSSGNIYVCDRDNDRVVKFNSSGTKLTEWGSTGIGDGEFRAPHSLETDGTSIWVTEITGNRVQKFSLTGTYESQFGGSGTGDGKFDTCNGIAIDPSGNIYVCDRDNTRVQKFDSEGTYLSQFGTSGINELGKFTKPQGIAIDQQTGNIFVVDIQPLHENIQIFEPDHTGILRHEVDQVADIAVGDGGNQTIFYRYPTTSIGDKVPLGTPDGGSSVPALTAFDNTLIRPNEWIDLHDAIEAIAVAYTNAATGNAFTWTADADNLYTVAVDAGEDDWDKPILSAMQGERITTQEWDEADACVTKLEASNLHYGG